MTDKTNGEEDIALVQFEETVCHAGVGMAAVIIREGLEATGGAWEKSLIGQSTHGLGVRRGAQKPEGPGCVP